VSAPAFDPLKAMATLLEHKVRFVVIGGLAGRLWGSPTLTNDLDICYARDTENLKNLSRALKKLGARLRGVTDDVPFLLDARTLAAGDHFTFVTSAGNLDCLGHPAGINDFGSLERNSEEMDLGSIRVKVGALEDLMRMKKAAGRPKDLVELEILGALRDEIERDLGQD
jgi:hypothetical protein